MVRRIKAKLVPGLRGQGPSHNAIVMGYGMSKRSVIDVFDAEPVPADFSGGCNTCVFCRS
ncbi:hypothetical protein EHS19_09450 [Bifidobacterium jacchi]|uniref:Uncharacterized protein n=1 Tax=Bifidobacterium jacchi TaxID=2490545 RepID=A0A5N5RDI7_9BIFI|nr:hypothetical protein EHS19_09450 [Bifidobacterium jacchi]